MCLKLKMRFHQLTRPAWAGFKTAEEGRANTPFGGVNPVGPGVR